MLNYKKAENEMDGQSYGVFECPECGSCFYGGGRASHERTCSRTGYDGLTYHFSTHELQRWNEEVLEPGFAANLPLSPDGLSDYFLQQAIADGRITPDQVRAQTEKYVREVNVSYLPGVMENLEKLIQEAVERQKEVSNDPVSRI